MSGQNHFELNGISIRFSYIQNILVGKMFQGVKIGGILSGPSITLVLNYVRKYFQY